MSAETVGIVEAPAPGVNVAAKAPAWEPRIVALVCNWCSYAGADMAGTTRRSYAANVRVVRLMCTGRIDPMFIVKAFEEGADGVLVSGCHPGDCHYVQGNFYARRRFTAFRALMEFLGLDQRRLHFAWVSASEGAKWSGVVDQVTQAVREAGPLLDWGHSSAGRSTGPAPRAESAGVSGSAADGSFGPSVSRTPLSAEDNEAITAHLQGLAARLLSEGEAGTVVGYTAGSLPGQMVPVFATRPEDARALAWNERCVNNLTVYVREALKKAPGDRVAVVVKSCDARTVAALHRENQIDRERVLLLGVSCAGVWEKGRMAGKCHACREALSPLSDWTLTPEGAVKAERPETAQGRAPETAQGRASEAETARVEDARDTEIVALEAMTAQERWDYWQRQFALCLRCYACRAVCPMCYCDTCISDARRPQWIPAAFDGKGNTSWNISRAVHLAGRCTGCDECYRACPAGIRLDLINRRLVREIEDRFGYNMETDPGAPAPLTTFQPNDPDEFL